jgi:Tfp pilus assembly protein PilN
MRLKIDFSGSRPPPRTSSFLFFGIGIATLAVSAWECLESYREQHEVALVTATFQLPAGGKQLQFSPQQIEAVNHTIRQLNLPWQALLDAVEEHLSDKVALLSLEPDASARLLRLRGEAKTAADMLDFVAALGDDRRFIVTTLSRHEINDGDPNRPFRFVMEAEWSSEL